MRINRGMFWWGVFFISLGAVPLAVDLGWVSADAVRDLWRLWPLVLVGIGVGLILQRSQLVIVGSLISALALGLALGGLVSGTGVGGLPIIGCGSGEEAGGPSSGTLGSGGTITVDWACGSLTVRDQAGAAWQVNASGENAQTAVSAGETAVTVKSAGSFRFASMSDRALTVLVPADPTLALHVDQGFGDGTITLSRAHLSTLQAKVAFGSGNVGAGGASLNGTLDLSFSFGSGKVTLPIGTYTGSMSSSFGSLNVCVPPGLGVRINASSGFGSTDFGPGFVQAGGAWESTDYASAQNHADLNVSSSFGSTNISRCS